MQEIPKAYEPQGIEDAIYQMWLDSGYFNPDNLPNLSPEAENFSIVLPPPNVTGTLHMGHASMLAIEDAMVRFARLSGKRTVWIPGTDHAAIATQSKVEGLIFKAEGKNRHDLGREPFLARVREFAQNSHDIIVNQSKKMGSSLDWSREAYTLDDARNRAVVTAFKRMYDDGLIYRGHRVINWDPIGQTTIADDEIVYKETTATLYTFKYDKNFPIAISTTRPETKVGDAAVAVHPEDARYKEFVGKTFEVNFCGVELSIKVVADESVDPAFGTGALGVTPAHSTIDFEIAGRHGLALRQVIGEDARMAPEAGPVLAGLTTLEAREATVAWLRSSGLIISEEVAPQNISTAERTGGIVEPLPKLQWFIGVNTEFVHLSGKTTTLKKLMQKAVKSEAIEIIPERFNKTYFHWIDNLRDWCISRQIWFGHRVPAWYRGDEIAVGEMPAGEGWTQDPDTLDTWFSSGLWTFSTLGWPDETADLKRFHPTSVLETGYDILFFWVARMILMSTYLVDQVPFKTVYLHGLVRDAEGRKMSKSLGNIIDPLDMIAKYGADATRLSLMIGGAPGNDLKLSEEKIAGYRNFTNKLWNISRFVITKVGEARHVESVEPKTLSDRFILGRFAEVTERATGFMASHDFSLAGEALRDFAWNEFADWYLEIAKIEGDKDDILLFILERLLTMWHPFMPFVTEEIYKQFNRGLLMVGTWPKDVNFALSSADLKAFEELQNAVVAIRNLRAQYKVEPKMIVKVVVPTGSSILDQATIIGALSRAEISSVDEMPSVGIATAVVGSERVGVLLEGLVDVAKERVRIEKELETTKKYVIAQMSKLGNQDFVARAPEAVIAGEKEKLRLAEEKLKTLEAEMTALS